MRDLITLLEAKSKTEQIEIVPLAFKNTQFAPVISVSTMNLHLKLAHGYTERFNKDEGDSEFNYAGYFLHNLLFPQYREPRTNNIPNGPIGSFIKTKFKSYENFVDQISLEAMKLQGSNWIYLARDGSIKTIHNHEVRDDILLLIDMWEHAFIIDYGSDKTKYLNNIWRIINWNVINARWGEAYK